MTTPVCKGASEPVSIQAPGGRTGTRFRQLSLSPSRRLLYFILLTHALAGAAIWLSRLDAFVCFLVDLGVCVGAVLALRQHWLVGERVLVLREDGWELEVGGKARAVVLCEPVLLWSWMVVLRVRPVGGWVIPLVILADNCCAEERRRLRVWLRTKGGGE